MTLHYHGTPITPKEVLLAMPGKCFCVSYAHRDQTKIVHEIGQSIMHDNGAFSVWKQTKNVVDDWRPYYKWVEPLIDNPVHWAVIPDHIDGGVEVQDALLSEWPFGCARGAPVWHMDEPIARLLQLCGAWSRVCVGSTAEYAVVGSPAWRRRMDEAFAQIVTTFVQLPWLHMLRGMQTVRWEYPFASVDSTDVGRNHHRKGSVVSGRLMAELWDSVQCPDYWGIAGIRL